MPKRPSSSQRKTSQSAVHKKRAEEAAPFLDGIRYIMELKGFKETARNIFDQCKKIIGADGGYVGLLNKDSREMRLLFLEPGRRPCTVDAGRPTPIRGLREQAVRSRKAVFNNDFPTSEWQGLLPEGHVRLDNVLFAPLIIQGKVVGLLGLGNKPGGFNEQDAATATNFAELATIALHNSQTLEALEYSEERFRAAAQSATDAIISIDQHGNVVFWNAAAQTIFGWTVEEMLGKPLERIYPQRFRADHRAGIERVASTGQGRLIGGTTECVGLRRDGSEFPIELSLSKWQTHEGTFFTGIVRDIAERKRVEEEYRTIINTAMDGFWITGTQGQFLDVNAAYSHLIGYSREELLKMRVQDVEASEKPEKTAQHIQKLIEIGHDRFETQHRCKDGRVVDIEVSTNFMPSHGGRFYVFLRDITARKRADNALALNAVRLELLLELHKLMDALQPQLLDFTLDASLKTTQSQLAFIGLMDDAEAVMTIHAWSKDALAQCALDDKPSRFPIAEAGIWAECVRRRAPFMLNQYDDPHPGKKGVPAGHVPIKRLLAIPVFDGNRIVAVAAVANKAEDYTESDSHALTVLLDRMWSIIRRQQAEEALQKSSAFNQSIIDSSHDCIKTLDLEGRLQTMSLGGQRLFEIQNLDDYLNIPYQDFWKGADSQAALEAISKAQHGLFGFFQGFAPTAKGTPKWWDVSITPIMGSDGKPERLLAVSRDITERKRAEEEYRTIISTTMDGFWITDLQGHFLDVNDAYCHLIGYSREELLKMGVQDVEAVEKPEETARHIQKVIETGYDRFETLHRCKDGRGIAVEASANYRPGEGGRFFIFLRDITARKQAEDSLRASEGRLHLATRAGNIGIWDWDVVKNELTWDDSMYSLYGIRKEDFGGAYEAWSRTLHPDDRQFAEGEIQAALRGEREYAPEFRIVQPDGAVRIIKAASQTFRDRNGKALRMIGTNIDITGRKRVEAEILKLNAELEERAIQLEASRDEAEQANRAKSEFLSRMSHELRTPLNSILGFSQLLEMDELTPDQREGVSQILKSGRHLLDLINEVLDISRIEAGRMELSPETIHVEEAILQAVDLIRPLADQRRITIHIQVPSSRDVFVTADRQRFKQVLLNLLSNAVKYNREQGEIRIIASLLVDGYLHLQVQDTGEGLPPDKMARLFNPFDRLGIEPDVGEGTGLGLALSKRLAEAMGGRMGAESVVGEGSTFWLDLRLTTQQEEALVMAEMDDYLKTTPGRVAGMILYVEDNLSNIKLMEKIVAWLPGIELISAMQGRMAMDLARQHKPRLILLDLNLPDMNGEEVLQWLRADPQTKDIPVVVMSADAMPAQIEHMLVIGAYAYLTKPIDVKGFLKMLDEMLGNKDGKE